MRSTIIVAAAFAASALAVPYANPDVVTAYETDVVYATNIVTVTQGDSAPTTVAAADAATSSDEGSSWGGNGGWHWPHKHHSKKTKTRTHTATPPASTPTSTYEAPEPTTTWAPEPSTTQAPATTQKPTTSAAAAPSGVSGYNDIVVAHHNVHRANHSAPDCEWDAALAATAAKIAAGCVYAHDV